MGLALGRVKKLKRLQRSIKREWDMYFWLICNHQNPEILFQIFERDIYFKYYVNVLFNILQLCFVDNRMSKLCIMLCTELKKKKIKVFLPVDKPILKLVPVASFFKMKYSHEILTRLCVFIRHSNVYWCAKHLVTLRVWFNWAEQVFFFFSFCPTHWLSTKGLFHHSGHCTS